MMPQTVAGESVMARVVPVPKAKEEGSKESIITAVMAVKMTKEEKEGGFFI